jgi:exonuclease VII small subunit
MNKAKKEIDYLKVPPHVFEKAWESLVRTIDDIEQSLLNVEAALRNFK